MSRPGYFMDRSSFESGAVDLYLTWISGASGAVPAKLTRASHFKSVTHGATGVYVVVLSGKFPATLKASGDVQQATYSASGACNLRVTANDIAGSTMSITLLATTAAGAAVEPASGDILTLKLELQTHTAGY